MATPSNASARGTTAPVILGQETLHGEVVGETPAREASEQEQAAQHPGGGGAPGTGASTASPFSPGEGVNETQQEDSGAA